MLFRSGYFQLSASLRYIHSHNSFTSLKQAADKPTNCLPFVFCAKIKHGANRIGTSEVVRILSEKFVGKNIAKFDKDEVKTTKQLHKILDDNLKKLKVI